MKNFYRAMRVHISYANIIDHVKLLIEKEIGKEVNIETVTFVMAKNTIIDGKKLLIVLPSSKALAYIVRKKEVSQLIYTM